MEHFFPITEFKEVARTYSGLHQDRASLPKAEEWVASRKRLVAEQEKVRSSLRCSVMKLTTDVLDDAPWLSLLLSARAGRMH